MKNKLNPYSPDDYELRVRFDTDEAEFTAQVVEMPGVILGAVTAEEAVRKVRQCLEETIEWYNRDGAVLPAPGELPPPIPLMPRAAAATLGRKGGYVKSAVKAASSRQNLQKARAMGKVGGRPKGSKTKQKAAAAA